MAKKDFSKVNVNRVYDTIADATAEETPTAATEPRKERKTYTAEEKKEFLDTLKTAGHKGCKLPRINLAFSPEVYDYVRTMSKVSGVTLTEFVNKILQQSLEDNRAVYEKAVDFRNSL